MRQIKAYLTPMAQVTKLTLMPMNPQRKILQEKKIEKGE